MEWAPESRRNSVQQHIPFRSTRVWRIGQPLRGQMGSHSASESLNVLTEYLTVVPWYLWANGSEDSLWMPKSENPSPSHCGIRSPLHPLVLHPWKCRADAMTGLCLWSVVSEPLGPSGLEPTRLLCPRGFLNKNIGAGCHFHFQGIFPTRNRTCVSSVSWGMCRAWF